LIIICSVRRKSAETREEASFRLLQHSHVATWWNAGNPRLVFSFCRRLFM